MSTPNNNTSIQTSAGLPPGNDMPLLFAVMPAAGGVGSFNAPKTGHGAALIGSLLFFRGLKMFINL